MDYREIANIIEEISRKNYIKAVIYTEKNIIDEVMLDKLYQEYYENDEINLLNDFFNK